MRTIVITGCAGLLGSHLTRHLIKKGYRVIGIDNLSGGYADYLPSHPSFNFHAFDLSVREAKYKLNNIFQQEKPTACYHFAAYAAEGLSPFIRYYNYTNNILASVNIINQCINHDTKMIFTSSMAVYGDQIAPFTEDMPSSPVDPYGVSKYAVEMDIKIAAEQHNMRYTIVRPHNIVGIYQNIWDRYRNVVGIFIRKVLDGEPVTIYGDGEQTRAFSDVKYYMDAFEKMIDNHNGQTYNVGADKAYTINQLANTVELIASENGYTAEKKYMQPRHEVKHAHCDHTKAKTDLGFSDETNLESMVDEMFKWAIREPKRKQKNMNYEIERGMYDYWK